MKHYATILSSVLLLGSQAPAQSQNPNIAWGVNGSHQIYHLSASGWALVPAPLNSTPQQVSVSVGGAVWALDQSGNIYAYNVAAWQLMPGNLAQVSVGAPNNVWGINGGGSIYQWNGSGWNLIANSFSRTPRQVSVGMDGTVWALDQGGNIYAYNVAAWQAMPGSLAQVSVGSANNVWGINGGNTIYQWNGTGWAGIPSPTGAIAQQVSVGSGGSVYLLDSGGNIYAWSGSTWQTIQGKLVQISAGVADRFTYMNSAVSTQGSGWSPQVNTSASAGGYLQDANAADTLTFGFTGTSVALYRSLDPNGGQATVTIDGTSMGVFDFYFPQQRWQVPAVIDHLRPGQHTLVLTVSAQKTRASAGHNVYIDTFAAPAPFVPNTDQQTALSRVNFHRNPLGSATPPMPPAVLNTSLDLAAQGASAFNAANNTLTHVENSALPGFVGVMFNDRANYFGYAFAASEDAFEGVDAAGSVDGWVDTVYHRVPILTYGYTDIGFGLSGAAGASQTVMDFGIQRQTAPVSRLLITYPVNGQGNVPTTFSGGEEPNPLPNGVSTTGYPISLQIAQPANPTKGISTASNTYSLTDGNNQPVAIYTLDARTDPNKYLNGDTFFMLPQQPLDPNSTYNAHIAGTDSQGNPFDIAWSFTTLPNAAVVDPQAFAITSNEAWVQWATAGPVTSTQLVYGTTTAYGTQASAPVGNGADNPNQVVANLIGLSPSTKYHYQITATDAQGHMWTTPDATFTTASITP